MQSTGQERTNPYFEVMRIEVAVYCIFSIGIISLLATGTENGIGVISSAGAQPVTASADRCCRERRPDLFSLFPAHSGLFGEKETSKPGLFDSDSTFSYRSFKDSPATDHDHRVVSFSAGM